MSLGFSDFNKSNMALIGAMLVEIKIIEILCERSLREGDRYALEPSTASRM